MDALRSKRIGFRIAMMFIMAVALAVFPPLIIKTAVMDGFNFQDGSQSIAENYTNLLKWCHIGGFAALLALNLGFFITNERKGDSGRTLHRRNILQGWSNFLLISLTIAVMVGCRYLLEASVLIGLIVYDSFYGIFMMLLPYIAFGVSSIYFCCLCMNAFPATNCEILDPIARKYDNGVKFKS